MTCGVYPDECSLFRDLDDDDDVDEDEDDDDDDDRGRAFLVALVVVPEEGFVKNLAGTW